MLEALWNTLLALAPWLLVGAAAAGALHVVLPQNFLRRQLAGRGGVVKAAAIGVPMPLCSCSVIPVGLSLRRQGASPGATVAFLISTPETGVDSISVSAGMLGWPFALFKVASAFAIGVVGGLLANRMTPAAADPAPLAPAPAAPPSAGPLARGLAHALEILRSVWRWLALGIVASAAIAYYLPDGGLERFGAYGNAAAMVAALAISIPLYVCALASVPIAAALVGSGFPPGAALVFLIAGPATNVATIGAVYRALGRRTLAVYLATIIVGSVACGLLFEGLIPTDVRAAVGHVHHDAPHWWTAAAAVVLVALLGWFAVDDVRRLLRPKTSSPRAPADAGSVELAVEGMTCLNCVARLEQSLARQPGVASAAVTLEPGRAVVHGAVSAEEVRRWIAQAGFHAP